MILYAVNVHTGGGKVLLDELIEGREFGAITALFVDSRYDAERALKLGVQVFPIPPTILARFKAESELAKIATENPEEEILFFGNLPPIRRIANKSILYLQNCFLIPPIPLPKDSAKVWIRTFIERVWLRLFIKNIDVTWVQTKWMKELFQKQFPNRPVEIKPFCPKLPALEEVNKIYDYILVTSHSKHKNLNTVIAAFKMLDSLLKKPVNIALVLDSGSALPQMTISGFRNIKFHIETQITRDELAGLYSQSRNSIIASSYESFCLPLYESAFYGLKVIALNTAFARESQVVGVYYENNDPKSLAKTLLEMSDA